MHVENCTYEAANRKISCKNQVILKNRTAKRKTVKLKKVLFEIEEKASTYQLNGRSRAKP